MSGPVTSMSEWYERYLPSKVKKADSPEAVGAEIAREALDKLREALREVGIWDGPSEVADVTSYFQGWSDAMAGRQYGEGRCVASHGPAAPDEVALIESLHDEDRQ